VFTVSSPLAFEAALAVADTAAQAAIPGLLAVNQNVGSRRCAAAPPRSSSFAINLYGRAAGRNAIGITADALHDLRLAMLLIAPGALAIAAICAVAGMPSLARDTATRRSSGPASRRR
jgi:hypothetical protein